MRATGFLISVLTISLIASGQDRASGAHGTVNELMIGIIDPNTNMVGNAAFLDPTIPTEDSAFDPFAVWPKIEAAAIAMAEPANLLMIPGRLCSNGQAAPIDQEDWIGWTAHLRAAGLAGYDAARRQSQDTLVELSEELSASCTDCHARYLDAGGNAAARCRP